MSTAAAPRILVVGAGGHARVCIDVASTSGVTVVGALSRDGGGVSELGTAIVGRDTDFDVAGRRLGVSAFCVAIGENSARRRWAERVSASGFVFTGVISPSGVVSDGVRVGAGVQILPSAVVNAGAVLGDGVIVNTNATVEHDCLLGAFTHVAPGSVLGGGVVIGEEVLVGLGSRILPNLRVGDGAVVGAGAVVTRDVPNGATVVGVPAQPVARPDRDRAGAGSSGHESC